MNVPPPTPLTYAAPGGLVFSPEHLAQITAARATGAKIRRASAVAMTGGWLTGTFAALTILTSLNSAIGLFLGTGMAVVSYFEFRGSGELKRLTLGAPRRLAINQIAFGVLLFVYAAVSLWQSIHSPSPLLAEAGNDPELRNMLAGFEDIGRSITALVYYTMMFAAVVGPGLTAWYYASRAKYLEAYLRDTPPWILDLQRAGMSV